MLCSFIIIIKPSNLKRRGGEGKKEGNGEKRGRKGRKKRKQETKRA